MPGQATFRGPGVRGVCVWLTGLSGAGKSTTARALQNSLCGHARPATVLDGDEVRQRWSPALGFSQAERHANVMRIARLALGVVAMEQIAICAVISPARASRAQARDLIGAHRFLEVLVDATPELCETRDPKGLYARFRSGELAGMSGFDTPYEAPVSPDLVLHQGQTSVHESVHRLLALLSERGVLTR